MKKSICRGSQSSVALYAEDWDTLEHPLKSTICEQDRDGGAVAITMQYPPVLSIIEARLEFMD
jgi:hypothetical protein